MATFKICVSEHHLRKDGKYRVSIRLTHNGKKAYIKTDVYVTRRQIAADFKSIKDTDTVRHIDKDIIKYENILLKGLGSNLSRFTAKELVEYLNNHVNTDGGASIDFIAFSRQYAAQIKRKAYAERYEAIIRALIDFFGKETVTTKEINSRNLTQFAAFLQTRRTMIRVNQHGKKYELTRPPVKEQTAAAYLATIKTLFNAACAKYNDEDAELSLITHNPFRKPFVKVTDEPEKRDLSVEDLVRIIRFEGGAGRMELARDVFLLSFYFIGMNTVDIYSVEASALSDGRLTYRRQKTVSRRKDEALISIRIEPEVEALIKKYRDPSGNKAFRFYRKYSTYRIFNSAVNKGLKQLAKELGMSEVEGKLSTYYARHTVATIAYNHCGCSETEIGFALNHVSSAGGRQLDNSLKVTRGYINRDWSRIDALNRVGLDFVKGKIEGRLQ